MEPLPWITVVSGLPRSGTSLMMQMLAAGGIPPLTDAQRPADPSNPRGYLELEAVKRLKTERSWLPQARGKAVKIIHLLLPELEGAPRDENGSPLNFRIVMMRRPIAEIVGSQRAMLAREGKAGATIPDTRLGQLFTEQLARGGTLAGGQAGVPGLRGAVPGVGDASGGSGGAGRCFPGRRAGRSGDGPGRRSRAAPREIAGVSGASRAVASSFLSS